MIVSVDNKSKIFKHFLAIDRLFGVFFTCMCHHNLLLGPAKE